MTKQSIFTTKQELQDAVTQWCTDKDKAKAKYGDISTWNTSQITNMNNLFRNRKMFNDNIASWDVSSVMEMSHMLSGASSFNQPLDSWNVSNVKNMSYLFHGASSFNQPLDSWNVSNLKYTHKMFNGASSFNQPLNTWDVSNVTNMSRMFSGANSFNASLNICLWNVSRVRYIRDIFNKESLVCHFGLPMCLWINQTKRCCICNITHCSKLNRNLAILCLYLVYQVKPHNGLRMIMSSDNSEELGRYMSCIDLQLLLPDDSDTDSD